MASAENLISVEEYIRTSYSPDCDYVDGVVVERNLGMRDHSWAQALVATSVMSRFPQTGVAALIGWRFQTSPTRFRVPDVVFVRGRPDEKILTKPPLLCIEILSPEDRLSRVNARIKEYLDFGVPPFGFSIPKRRRSGSTARQEWKERAGTRCAWTARNSSCRSAKSSTRPSLAYQPTSRPFRPNTSRGLRGTTRQPG